MPNPQNIIPPKKGEIRNPKGRGKGVPNKRTTLKKFLNIKMSLPIPGSETDENPEGEKFQGTVLEAIHLALLSKGMQGDLPSIKEIFSIYYKETEKEQPQTDQKQIVNIYLPEKEQLPEDEQL